MIHVPVLMAGEKEVTSPFASFGAGEGVKIGVQHHAESNFQPSFPSFLSNIMSPGKAWLVERNEERKRRGNHKIAREKMHFAMNFPSCLFLNSRTSFQITVQ